MEYRRFGASGLKVPVLSFGTATFGGGNEFFRKWGATDVAEASRLIDVCLDAGVNFFDTADAYSGGLAEEILGEAIGKRRGAVLIGTKVGYRTGPGPNDIGASRQHIVEAVHASLKRLKTDHIDLLHMHGFDEYAPVEETLGALDGLVRAGKVRYVGGSNYSGWQMMKMLAAADRLGLVRPVSQQVHYSLLAREFENELMPLGADQGVGAMIWSPLSGGRLSGKVRRGQAAPEDSRTAKMGAPADASLHDIVDVLAEIARERGVSISQAAINWLLRRATVANVAIGARTEAQLVDNLGAVGWALTPEEVARLDAVSAPPPAYPYSHQRNFPDLVRPQPGVF